MEDVHETGWRESLRVLPPSEYLGLALVWPIVGAVVTAGIIIAGRLAAIDNTFSFPAVDIRHVLLQFVSWSVVTPVIVILAIEFRPDGERRRIFFIHSAAALIVSVAGLLLRPGGGDVSQSPAGYAANLCLRLFLYIGIVLTTWSLLLFRSMRRSVAEERRIAAVVATVDRDHLASTAGYLSLVLRNIEEQLDRRDRAEPLTVAVANLLREQLRGVSASSWSFMDEIGLVDRLADVEALRGHTVRITVDVPENDSTLQVPPGWIVGAITELFDSLAPEQDVSIVFDADGQTISGRISAGGRSVTLPALARWRNEASSNVRIGIASFVAGHARIVPTILFIAWTFTTIVLLLRAIDHHYPIAGWFSLVSPLRALTWVSVVGAILWRAPVALIGRWTWLVALSIGSAWAAEWFYMLVYFTIGAPTSTSVLFRGATAFALMGLGPAVYTMLTMGAALSAVRIARECAAILERESAARLRLSRVKANLLRQQMNPHFLFNALNSLAALILRSREAAAVFITKLRKFHDATAGSGRELVDVATEIALTHEYLDIERTRFARPIAVDIDVHPAVLGALVPPLSIQSLVENAVKHGDSTSAAIRATVRMEGRWVLIQVENRVAAVSRSQPGIGLLLLRQRLDVLFNGKATLSVNRDGELYRVELRVPPPPDDTVATAEAYASA